MKQRLYVFKMADGTDLEESKDTLWLSMLAAEGIVGESRVRSEVEVRVRPGSRAIEVCGHGQSIGVVTQIFTALLAKEFGRGAFEVSRKRQIRTAA